MVHDDRVEILDWETDFWGFVTARIADGPVTPTDLASMDELSAKRGVRLLYYCCAADDPTSSLAAQAAGFFFTDIRLVMTLADPTASSRHDALRPADRADVPEVQRLAAICHTNTRFAADPHIDPARRAELYRRWIVRDMAEAPLVLVAEHGGSVCGYVTASSEGSAGSVRLLGVDPATRSAGLGGALFDAALGWCASQGVDVVRIVTQGSNVPAQRLFQNRGFRTSSVGLWFHKWYDSV